MKRSKVGTVDSCVHILSDLYENEVIDDLLIVLPTVSCICGPGRENGIMV